MIEVTIGWLNQEGDLDFLEVSGHAGYGDYGHDIVCAAVSSQVISFENSLDHLLDLPVRVDVDQEAGGYLRLDLSQTHQPSKREAVRLLTRHVILALEAIAETYPDNIRVITNNH